MLYFLIVWTVLTFICFSIGITLLHGLKASCFKYRGDRFIISIWLGLITLCLSLLTASLFFPLSPLVAGVIAFAFVALSLLFQQIRNEIFSAIATISPQTIVGFFVAAIAVAALTTQQIVWFDSGLYHLGIIHWLSQFGAVPGIALIYGKLGFSSSWFALAAPLIPDFLADRVGAITNGFVFWIAICHFLICWESNFRGDFRLSNWFTIFFFGTIITIYIATAFAGSPILISFSTDVPVTLSIGVIAWAILIISNSNQTSIEFQTSFFDVYLIPLILSAGAVSIKLSAIAILPVTFLFYIFGKSNKIKRFILAIVILICLLLPNFTVSVIASGCPLYPSMFMCFNVPWAVSTVTASDEITQIHGVKTSATGSNDLLLLLQKRLAWLRSSIKLQFTALLTLISLIFSTQLLATSTLLKQQIKGQIWLIFLGISGITFMILTVPLLRFGVGYFILIPSLFISKYCLVKLSNNILLFQLGKLNSLTKIQAKWVTSFVLCGFTTAILIQPAMQSRFLLPSKLPRTQLITQKINDIEYTYPDNWYVRCWLADLPCAAIPIQENIRLRDASRGIKAGFIRAEEENN